LITYFLSIAIFGAAATATVGFLRARESLTNSTYNNLNAVSTLKEVELQNWVNDQLNEIIFISNLPLILDNVFSMYTHGEGSQSFNESYSNLEEFFLSEIQQKLNFQEMFLMADVGGKILLSTDKANEGQYRVSNSYFTQGRLAPFVQNVYTSPQTGEPTLTISSPVYSTHGTLIGVLAAHVDLDWLDSVVLERTGLGETGESYLVDSLNNFVSEARFGDRSFPLGVHTAGIDAALSGQDGFGLYTNYAGIPVIGSYKWLDAQEIALITEISQEEGFQPARTLAAEIVLTGVLLSVLLTVGIYFLTQQVTRPLVSINETVEKMAAGDLSINIPVKFQDEIGQLGNNINQMASQLDDLIKNLEERVAERTAEVEKTSHQVQIRAEQFEAIAQISRIISSIQNLEELLPRITRMISQYFGFYHTGIFLLDEYQEFAVLRASNSEGGQKMLESGHRLAVGETGIVGFVTATGNPRIALDTGADSVYFDNPDLPETRSEMALPLKAGNQIIGALDVQSTVANAFSEDDINILSALADQVSTAIQNASLHEESREALTQAEMAFRQLTGQTWTDIQRFTSVVGYRFDGTKPEPLTEPSNTYQTDGLKEAFSIPVQLRGETIGRLQVNSPSEDHKWSEDEIAIIRATAERVALAAENARLVLDSQKRASKERVISEISTKIGAAINLDNILQTTLREMGRILPGAEISIQVEND